jgi:hypothetical protein
MKNKLASSLMEFTLPKRHTETAAGIIALEDDGSKFDIFLVGLAERDLKLKRFLADYARRDESFVPVVRAGRIVLTPTLHRGDGSKN